VGIFVFSSGSAERALADVEVALSGVHVADVMTPNPFSVPPESSAAELLALARHAGHPVYPVVGEGGNVAGLVSVASAQQVPLGRRGSVTVGDLVSSRVDAPIDADAEAASSVATLAASPLHRKAVVRGGLLVGMVTFGDLTRAADGRTRPPRDPAGAYLNGSTTGAPS
jgi:CBS domain-containing protein